MKNKYYVYNSVLYAMKFQARATITNKIYTDIIECKRYCGNQIDDLNCQRKDNIESITFMISHPQFEHSYRKGKPMMEGKLYNICNKSDPY